MRLGVPWTVPLNFIIVGTVAAGVEVWALTSEAIKINVKTAHKHGYRRFVGFVTTQPPLLLSKVSETAMARPHPLNVRAALDLMSRYPVMWEMERNWLTRIEK
jgi:hypothetical protein